MKELERKDTPEIGGGAYTPIPDFPGGPIITPTYPVPTPQYPTPGIDPTGSHQKV
jgi:hypothetical protein